MVLRIVDFRLSYFSPGGITDSRYCHLPPREAKALSKEAGAEALFLVQLLLWPREVEDTVITWVANILICTRMFLNPSGSHRFIYLVSDQNPSFVMAEEDTVANSSAYFCVLCYDGFQILPLPFTSGGIQKNITALAVSGM